ncbi:hypothetical protein Unana1_00495 [Umbelopsis nana]
MPLRYYIPEAEVSFPSADMDPYTKIPCDIDWVREDYYYTVLGKIMASSSSEQTFAEYKNSCQSRYREALDIGTRWNNSFDRYQTMLRYQQQCEERQRRLHRRANRALQEALRVERARRSTLVGICNELRTHPEEAADVPPQPNSSSDEPTADDTCVGDDTVVSVNEKLDHAGNRTVKHNRLVSVMKKVTRNMTKSIKDACCWHPVF